VTPVKVATLSLAAAVVAVGCGPAAVAPTINSFLASEPTLPATGGTVTLSWDVTAASELSIDNGLGTTRPVTKGSVSVNVTATTTFTLTATNGAGMKTANVTVIVLDYAAAYIGTCKGNTNAPAAPMYSYTLVLNNVPYTVDAWAELVPASWSGSLCGPPLAETATTMTVTEVSTNVIQIVGMLNATLPVATVTAAGAALPGFFGQVKVWDLYPASDPLIGCLSNGWYELEASFSPSVVSISTSGELEMNISGTFSDLNSQGSYTLTYTFAGTKS